MGRLSEIFGGLFGGKPEIIPAPDVAPATEVPTSEIASEPAPVPEAAPAPENPAVEQPESQQAA